VYSGVVRFSRTEGRQVVTGFDGGAVTSEAGVLLVERDELALLLRLDRSWFGRARRAIRDNPKPPSAAPGGPHRIP